MDRDSEAETVLADEDWLEDSNSGIQNTNNCRDVNESGLGDDFDEEELFSPSGSLSSLDEFSDASEYSSASNTNKPIIRNGASNDTEESELDVGDATELLSSHSEARSSPWLLNRGRKIIDDDDDAGHDADTDDIAENRNADRRDNTKHNYIESKRRKRRRKPNYEDPDYIDENGQPQLLYFASIGETSICRELLLRGASINIKNAQGSVAIYEATRQGHIDTLKLFLDPPFRTHLPTGSKSQLDCKLLSPYPDVNASHTRTLTSPLHQAVLNDDIQAVRLLLDHGARVDAINSKKLTPLDICTNEKIARLLTDRAKVQRHISSRDKAGQAKLHRACNAGDLNLAVSLINQGAEINMKDNASWTPLHEAALEGHNDVTIELLRHGADYAARGFGGDTPLHDSCANGHVDVVRCLLIVGADPLLKNTKGVTPKDMADDDDEVLDLINKFQNISKPKDKGQLQIPHTLHGKGKGDEDIDIDVDIEGREDSSSFEDAASSRKSLKSKTKPERPSSPRKHKPQKRSDKKQRHGEKRPNATDMADSSKAPFNRELLSLKRLRDEAEKPRVNYYFSSENSSRMTRDERKLQVLMSTIERMEKQPPKKKHGKLSSCNENIGTSIEVVNESDRVKHDIKTSKIEHSHDTLHAYEQRDKLSEPKNSKSPLGNSNKRRNGSHEQDSALSPKRRRGRPPKKRVIDDDDEDTYLASRNGGYESSGTSPKQNQDRNSESPKKSKHSTHKLPHTAISINTSSMPGSPTADTPGDYISQSTGPSSKSRIQQHHSRPPKFAKSSSTITAISSTVKIKCEPITNTSSSSHSQFQKHHTPTSSIETTVHAIPTPTISDRAAVSEACSNSNTEDNMTARSTTTTDIDGACSEQPSKKSPEMSLIPASMSASSIAAQAIRYLPLYTVQLQSGNEVAAPKLDYFVVDLQIRLLLGMPIETQTDTQDGTTNPLFLAYPELCRKRITEQQKERLWGPLAGMFVSNMRYIHDTLTKEPPKALKDKDASPLDSEVVQQFTLHESKKFVALELYFVKLDEIVEIVKRDYPQISKHLITITLDINNISSECVQPSKTPLRRLASLVTEKDESSRTWNGPQKMLPLKYALKLYFGNRDDLSSDHMHL